MITADIYTIILLGLKGFFSKTVNWILHVVPVSWPRRGSNEGGGSRGAGGDVGGHGWHGGRGCDGGIGGGGVRFLVGGAKKL